jgi:hypothetical protein
MRQVLCALAITLAGTSLTAQNLQTPPPQSARQALIEMFLGKGENDLANHLPDITRKALIRKDESPESSIVLRIAAIGRSMAAQGRTVETFDTGPNILVTDEPDHERVEVAVEHDSLMGDQDEIELSVHGYKDGQEENLPVIPRLIFTMKQEKDVWRLTEIIVAGHIPLTDPDYLKGLRKQQDDANEQMAQMRMNMIVNGQKAHSATHPEIGYACALSSLVPQKTESTDAERTPASFDPGLGTEQWNGYRFTLNGCGGTPSSKYRLAAVPIDSESTAKTFCADESGKVKFVTSGKPSACFSGGQELNPPPAYAPVVE